MRVPRVFSVRPWLRPWGLLGANYFLVTVLAVAGMFAVRSVGGEAADRSHLALAPGSLVGLMLVGAAGALSLAFLVCATGYRREAGDGRLAPRWKLFLLGAALGGAAQALDWGQFAGLNLTTFAARIGHAARPFGAAGAIVLFGLFYALVPPLVEEVFVRGLLFDSFARHYSTGWAIALSAVCFSALHWESRNVELCVVSFLLGLLFAAMRAKTGNLSFGYGAHIVFNGTYWVVWLLGGHGLPFEVSELLR